VFPRPRTTLARSGRAALVGGLGLAVSLALAVPATAAPATADRHPASAGSGPVFSTDGLGLKDRAARRISALAAGVTPEVGTVRQWLGSDEQEGRLYRKDYVLRSVGAKVEVWVAQDTAFPAGDCRGTGATQVSDVQAAAIAAQFDGTIHPRQSTAFSVAPDRDGSNALLGPDANGNGGDYTGAGDKLVLLVDNVRDANFYAFPANPDGIPGFFSSQLDELFDRNVVTLDAYDWLHRTTANPPDATTADPCTSRPARPYLYEKVLANSYQRLLESYADPNESTWLVEGLAAYAEGLAGYADPRKTVLEKGADRRILCYQGFGSVKGPGNPAPAACGGPENSLTAWGDQGQGSALLADQGAVWTFLVYLRDRFGTAFVKDLHTNGSGQGLFGLQQVLDARATGVRAPDVVHDFQVATLVDVVADTSQSQVRGTTKAQVVSAGLRSTVNLTEPKAYAGPGAPVNGADVVWLRDTSGRYLSGSALTSASFTGDATKPPAPLTWSVVTDDPDRAGNPVLWSGDANGSDAYALTRVTVPTDDPTLTYLAKYGAELGYDYGYTVVSTDGGATFTALAGDKTVDGPDGPAVNGTTNGFEPHSFDLSAYAGQSVLLGFRYVSDGGVNEGGWYVDDVRVGSTPVSDGSSTAPFQSREQVRPVANTFVTRLVGIDPLKLRVLVQTYPGRTFTRSRSDLAAFKDYPVVVAVVSSDDLTETQTRPAGYRLVVNGALQPGGS
jgi:hypothetical protein